MGEYMRKHFFKAAMLAFAGLFACVSLYAQGPIQNALNRFTDPDKGRTVFIEKGHYALGISGGYHNFSAGGDAAGEGYSILSILNIGNGKLTMYEATPSFSYFVADDLSLGVRLDYDGYLVDTDLRANLGELFDFSGLIDMAGSFAEDEEDALELEEELKDMLNLRISGRHMVKNSWGTSLALRKYLSFFGSQSVAVFGEARLYGKYGIVNSCPIDEIGVYKLDRMRTSDIYSAGLKFCGGLCLKLRDNSAITVSVPIMGASYTYTKQHKETKSGPNNAHMSQFNITRDVDFLSVQVGYTHYIKSKKQR